MNILIPGNLSLTLNHLWAMLVIVAIYTLVTSPKIIKSCLVLSSYTSSLFLELWYYLVTSFKEAKSRIRNAARKLIYTAGREWLDETEKQITE